MSLPCLISFESNVMPGVWHPPCIPVLQLIPHQPYGDHSCLQSCNHSRFQVEEMLKVLSDVMKLWDYGWYRTITK